MICRVRFTLSESIPYYIKFFCTFKPTFLCQILCKFSSSMKLVF
nr:MAG TPA_asm: hypothetical protein [Bacteriophage sp.]